MKDYQYWANRIETHLADLREPDSAEHEARLVRRLLFAVRKANSLRPRAIADMTDAEYCAAYPHLDARNM